MEKARQGKPFRILFKHSPYRKPSVKGKQLNRNISPYWQKQFDTMFAKW